MTDPDQEFEAYLQRHPVLPTLGDKLEPPAALDAKVLAQAREAIQPHSASGDNVTSLGAAMRPTQRAPRWAVPVALAATILLCLSVVMNISLNTNRPSPNLERMSAARADVKASASANATAESDAAAGVSARAPIRDSFAANNGERRESISGDIPSREVVLPRAKIVGAPAPHAPVVAEAPAGASGSLADSAPPAAPPALASAEARARQFKRSLAETDTSPSAASSAQATPTVQGEVGPRDEASDARTDLSAADKAVLMAKQAGVASPESTPAPEADRVAGRQTAKRTMAAAQTAGSSGAAAAPPAVAPPATEFQATAPQAAEPSGTAPRAAEPPAVGQHPADPKVWLQQIAALRAAGKADKAEAEMRRFKAAFPNYTLPK